jgi:hypothetical protein
MPGFIPLAWPVITAAGRVIVTKAGQQVAKNVLPKLTGSLNKRKLYDTFMDVSEKVASSKPVQALQKNLEKANPTIRKVAPDGAPMTTPMEHGVTKTVIKVLRGKALRAGSQKVQAIKDQLEEGTISENKANKLIKQINRKQSLLEKTKESPWM